VSPDESASTASLADAVSVLKKATDSLKNTAREPSRETTPRGGVADEDRRRYYRDLEELGALVDVEEGTDLASLPSRVTHVRYPNGRVERVGYT
jgi:hypothetical protein